MLITGASGGIGAATAKIAAQEGAQVVLLARTRSKLDQVANDIQRNGGRACVYSVDLTDADAVTAVAESIKVQVGIPDVIMNNAGIGQWKFVEETSSEEAVRMMAAPYFAAFSTTRAFLPDMLKRNSGTIINMTSIASRMAWPGATTYTAARWAMRGFAEGLRADLYGTKISTMLVTFAKVKSAYWKNNPGSEEKVPGAQSMIPVLTSEQAARAIIRGIKRNRREVIAPFTLRVLISLNNLFPAVTRWLLVLTGHKRESSIRRWQKAPIGR
ncbi:MAG: SDR family NAD(P)-dependent oxidoreductase [Chloroflexi bacterium]|nr:SDR family NAD(P)-dependent oxidoreductase [Chloroflexota bacterium]